ncbi:MAG: Regulatory protein AtoC [Nitrospirae bacterium]|nr:Regulatory protein AtoC [Nitrospirota bacterium]MCE7965418.1 sigma-54-dependent Fis family transcriptional regulator [Nitrospira sp. NTP2]MCK6493044.1 sigma-54 dependent transcriptional regulator [Nitrospira sp.]MEB2338391.1 sigma-54 dependent transcriptional regulator [Nitrospirales bacterium]QOJ36210.1 MAG: sigma-54-dependent Fis family transcriptional regulator [Nitrospira sp.]
MGIAGKVLIVDDEQDALENCRRILSRVPYHCLTENDPVRALDVIQRERPGLILTDLRMPILDGIEVLTAAKRFDPAVQVVLLTAHATVQTAVTSMRYGAFDYITKPFTSADLVQVARRAFGEDGQAVKAERAANEAETREEGLAGQSRQSRHAGLARVIGESAAMQSVFDLIEKVAPTPSNVLVYGESGTGKELVAHAIHDASLRADRPFIPVDCVSLPDTLLESELFGHEKGAFTGAHVSKPGLFEIAAGGTVFLDEVSGMSQTLQSRLLRVLQERQVRRVGGIRFMDVDVRVIAASNQDLEAACRRGEFREDLYYRLNVIPIALPPLRQREGDVVLLAREFLRRFIRQQGAMATSVPELDRDASDLLSAYGWPGNVRELQNVIERAAVLADGPMITRAHLPERLRANGAEDTAPAEPGSFKHAKQVAVTTFERGFLIDLLKRHDGHMGRAAREAGVDRKTIERMVKKHGLRELF